MIFVGIVFIVLAILIFLVVDDRDDRIGLIATILGAGFMCTTAVFIVKTNETNEAINLYKQGLLKEEITIKQTTEHGRVKIDTLYNYSRP